MFKERYVQLVRLEEILDRDIYFICHKPHSGSSMIDGTMIDVFRDMVRFSKRHEKTAIIVQTPGGVLDSTVYICEFFREYYDEVDTYIVGDCYSGGTLIALSSDNIYMSRNACLGPIDIQSPSKDPEENWTPDLYGMVTAITKAIKSGDLTNDILRAFSKNESVLATYYKMKYTYRELIGRYVEKHCRDGVDSEKVWLYMAELNLSHGSPLTYKKCYELGLDVKRMPENIEAIINKLVRDGIKELGGMSYKSALSDFYDNPGESIKEEKLEDSDGRVVTMMAFKDTESLGLIESVEAGYIQEMEQAFVLYGLIPINQDVLKLGWREEYNTSLALPEQNEMFEKQVDLLLAISLEDSGIEASDMTEKSYSKIREVIKQSHYDGIIKAIEKNGVDIDGMSSAQKWKAVVEYCEKLSIEQVNDAADTGDDELMRLDSVLKREAAEYGIDYDELDKDSAYNFFEQVLLSRVPKMLEYLNVKMEEYVKLSDEDRYSIIVEYMLECEADE